MLDKSDTFFLPKIERLVEGLPGTEFAPSYVFRANRSSSGGNQTWIHEAKIKLQKQQQKKQEKALKAAKHSEVKAKQEQEKVSHIPHVCLMLEECHQLIFLLLPLLVVETKTSRATGIGQEASQGGGREQEEEKASGETSRTA